MHEQVYKTTNIYNKLHMILYMFKLQEEKLRKRFHKILDSLKCKKTVKCNLNIFGTNYNIKGHKIFTQGLNML